MTNSFLLLFPCIIIKSICDPDNTEKSPRECNVYFEKRWMREINKDKWRQIGTLEKGSEVNGNKHSPCLYKLLLFSLWGPVPLGAIAKRFLTPGCFPRRFFWCHSGTGTRGPAILHSCSLFCSLLESASRFDLQLPVVVGDVLNFRWKRHSYGADHRSHLNLFCFQGRRLNSVSGSA